MPDLEIAQKPEPVTAITAEIPTNEERRQNGFERFIQGQMDEIRQKNPKATPDQLASFEAGIRSTAEKLLGMPDPQDVDAQIDRAYANRYAEGEDYHRKVLEAIDESGELATEQEVNVATKSAEWFKRQREAAEARANRVQGAVLSQPEKVDSTKNNPAGQSPAEEFDDEEWAQQHEINPEQNRVLYETVSTLQRKLAENWEAARKDELPKEAKDTLRRTGLNVMNITKNVIEEYFDPTYLKGLEQHDAGLGDRKGLQQLFNMLAANSKFEEPIKLEATGETRWINAKVDIYEDPNKAVQCLMHAYREASKDPNDPRAIAYGDLSMQILETLRMRLAIKVPEVSKAKFGQLIASLQQNERIVSQVK